MRETWGRLPPLMLTPALVWMLALLVVPLGLVVWTSATTGPAGQLGGAWTWVNFSRFLTDPYYLSVLWTTLRLGLLVTLLCLLLGYPFAWWVVRQTGWRRTVLLFAALMPLMVSVSIRTLGWIVLLAEKGPVSALLVFTGIVTGPIRLIYTEFAVVIGLVEALLPFMVLALFTTLHAIPADVLRAADLCGATPLQRFVRIILPLSLPGVMAGSVLVFTLSASAFVTPRILGGGRTMTMANLVVDQFLLAMNWPFGAAIGVLLFLLIGGVMQAERWFVRRRGASS